jgi:uncharacterized protein YrzB (UPF0473 family)
MVRWLGATNSQRNEVLFLSEQEHQHGDNCGCGEEQEQTFVITDENGVDHEMIMALTFDAEETTYAVLLDKNDPEADGLIFRIEEEGEEVFLVSIEDDEEWNQVVAIYNEIAESEQQA